MPSDVFPDSGSGSGPKLDDTTLNDTQKTSVSLFLEHGQSVETVASMREMKPSTIFGHLAEALKQGNVNFFLIQGG